MMKCFVCHSANDVQNVGDPYLSHRFGKEYRRDLCDKCRRVVGASGAMTRSTHAKP